MGYLICECLYASISENDGMLYNDVVRWRRNVVISRDDVVNEL